MSKKPLYALAVATVLVLSACSGGSKDNSAPSGTEPGGQTPDVSVVIDPEILAALNSDTGEAVIPGSIKSERVDTLDADCTEAVGGLRALMEEYPSLRQVPPDGTYDKAFADAKSVCEPADPQQWADFYTKELAGWIYAAVDVSDNVTVTSEVATESPATTTTAAPPAPGDAAG